jgi:hypothetical protein
MATERRRYEGRGALAVRLLGYSHLTPAAIGERLGGFVYGTIVVVGVVVAGAKAYPDGPGHIALLVVVTTVVFWLAHVYAHGLAHSISHGEHLSLAELGHIARQQLPIVESGVPSVVALLLGAIGLFESQTAIWFALGVGLAVLFLEGLVFARVERLGLVGTLTVVAANMALGILLIAMKLVVTH